MKVGLSIRDALEVRQILRADARVWGPHVSLWVLLYVLIDSLSDGLLEVILGDHALGRHLVCLFGEMFLG